MRLTLNKNERLKKRKLIDELFTDGSSIKAYPIKLVFKEISNTESPHSAAKYGVTVSKRYFKRAVDRNLIKRRMREAYRINKVPINAQLLEQEKCVAMMAIYIGKEILDYRSIEEATIKLLNNISKLL